MGSLSLKKKGKKRKRKKPNLSSNSIKGEKNFPRAKLYILILFSLT